jgi:hypothetical protein
VRRSTSKTELPGCCPIYRRHSFGAASGLDVSSGCLTTPSVCGDSVEAPNRQSVNRSVIELLRECAPPPRPRRARA